MPTVMMVDDDITFMLRMMLEKNGYNAAKAERWEECLEKLDEAQPDLILLDIIMQGMDGWEACRRLKKNLGTNSRPVCMLSIKKEPEDRRRSMEYSGATMHLGKPIDQGTLIDAVERLLKKHRK